MPVLAHFAALVGIAWVALLAALLPAATDPLLGLLVLAPGLACVTAGLLAIFTD